MIYSNIHPIYTFLTWNIILDRYFENILCYENLLCFYDLAKDFWHQDVRNRGMMKSFTKLLQLKDNFVFICIYCHLGRIVWSVHPYFILQLTSGQLTFFCWSPSAGQRVKRDSLPFKPKWLWQASFRVRIHVSHDTSTHTSIHPHTWSSSESREITITMKIDLLKSESKKGDAKGTVRKLEGG